MNTFLKLLLSILIVLGFAGMVIFGLCAIILLFMGAFAGFPLMFTLAVLSFILVACCGKLMGELNKKNKKAAAPAAAPVLTQAPIKIKVICPHCGGPNEICSGVKAKCAYCDMPIEAE